MSLVDQGVPLLVGVFVLYIGSLILSRLGRKNGKPPPGPKGIPLLGSALDLASSEGGNLIPIFNKWAKQYGPIVHFKVLGQKHIVLSSEKVANDLCVKKGVMYSDRGIPAAMRSTVRGLNTCLMHYTNLWRRDRKLHHRAISIATSEAHLPRIDQESLHTLRSLLLQPKDFENHFKRYAYGVLSHSILGFRVDSASHPFITETEDIIHEAQQTFRPDMYPSNVFPILLRFPSWLVRSNADLKRIELMGYNSIKSLQASLDEKLLKGDSTGSSSSDEETMTDSAYRHFATNRSEYNLSDDEAGYAFNSLIAGGTTSPHFALSSFLYLMMEYPEWQDRLQEEVDRVVGGDSRLPQFEDIPQLPTVRAVVKEVIRYRAIVAEPGIPHAVSQDNVYEGMFIEKGTVVHLNYSSIMTDPTIYPDGQPFNPSRWLDPSFPETYREPLTEFPNLNNYAPFGYGRRACPGYDLTQKELVILFSRIIWSLKIRRPVDPLTGREMPRVEVRYEPIPSSRPSEFPCDLISRGSGRERVVFAEDAGDILGRVK